MKYTTLCIDGDFQADLLWSYTTVFNNRIFEHIRNFEHFHIEICSKRNIRQCELKAAFKEPAIIISKNYLCQKWQFSSNDVH